MRQRPELRGSLLAKGGWDYQLVDELVPEPGDIVLPKPRYSGFSIPARQPAAQPGHSSSGVHRHRHQRVRGVDPCATAFPQYFGVVLEDATHQAGPDFAQKAALFNIETFLAGSVTSMISATRWIPARPHRLRRTAMPKSVIIPPGTSTPIAPFVPGTLADGVVYVSGTLPFDKDNNVVFIDDPKAQTRHVLETIKTVIETAGGTLEDVTFNSIFITDWKNYAAINEIYAEFFPGDKPARFCIQCGLVKPEALVEIATVAHIAK